MAQARKRNLAHNRRGVTFDTVMMMSYRVNFAKSGDPNRAGLPKWAAYDRESEPYIDFGDSVQLRNHLLKDQLGFLE